MKRLAAFSLFLISAVLALMLALREPGPERGDGASATRSRGLAPPAPGAAEPAGRREAPRGEQLARSLPARSALHGIVLRRADRTPLPGALLRLRLPAEGAIALHTRSDARGAFHFTALPPGLNYSLKAECPLFATILVTAIEVGPNSSKDVGELLLERACSARGIVLTAAGEPVPDARISAFPDRAAIAMGELIRDMGTRRDPVESTRSDERGRFVFSHLAADRYRVRAQAKGFAPVEKLDVEIQPTRPLERVIELRLRPGVPLEVLLRDRSGAPLTDQRLCLLHEEQRGALPTFSSEQARTDPGGRALFESVATGSYLLTLIRPARPLLVLRPKLEISAPRTIELTLNPGGSLAGHIRDESGRPLARARISLLTNGKHTPAAITTTSAADGSYRIDDLPAERIGIFSVTRPGYGCYPATKTGVLEHKIGPIVAGQVLHHDVVLPSGVEVRGRVLDARDSRPIAGAQLRFIPAGDLFGAGSPPATTDERGRYRASGVSPGRNFLEVRAPGYWTLRGLSFPLFLDNQVGRNSPFILAVPAAREPTEHDILLQPAATVRGTVLDPDGLPLACASLSWREEGPHPQRSSRDHTLNAEDGTFALGPLPPGLPLRIQAAAEGLQPALSEVLRLEPGGEFTGLELQLTQGAVLAGRVRTAAGEPARGAHLVLSKLGRRPPSPRWPRSASSDEQGRFRFADLPAGSFRLRTSLAGFCSPAPIEIHLSAGEARGDLLIALTPGQVLSGRVLELGAAPIAGAMVAIRSNAPGPIIDRRTRSDEQGVFRFESLPLTPLELRVQHPDFLPAQRSQVLPGQQMVIELRRARSITGRVVRASGEPVAGVWIQARCEGRPELGIQRARSSKSGEFRLRGLAEGSYSLSLAKGECQRLDLLPATLAAIAAGSRNVILTVQRGRIIAGRVRSSDGAPLAGIEVLAWRSDGRGEPLASARSDARGAFELRGLAPASFTIEARGQERGFANMRRKSIAAGTRDLLFALPAGLEIRGRVTDAQGHALAGIQVNAVPSADPRTRRSSAWTRTNRRGEFRLRGLSAIRYHIHAWGRVQDGPVHARASSVRAGRDDLVLIARVQGG